MPLLHGQYFPRWPMGPAWGAREVVPLPKPAAGADWKYTATGGQVTRVTAAYGKLVTSAEAASRRPSIKITDGNNIVCLSANGFSQAASKTFQYTFVPSLAHVIGTTSEVVNEAGFPDIPLQAGWTIGPVTENLEAGDQWEALTITLETHETMRDHDIDYLRAMAERLAALERMLTHGSV